MAVAGQRIGAAFLLAAGLFGFLGGTAEAGSGAGKVKCTYLKIGEGGGATVSAFTSLQAFEKARRRFESDWGRMVKQMKKQIYHRGTFTETLRARCLKTLSVSVNRRGRTGFVVSLDQY
jgi:hypothetical protein